ncbi:MAG TPA: single-stranded DNA-binding protein [Acidimicrobiales bacterium]|nr:single-stranded DNA-binding protein [Acidimicrobiales bacterium]
MNVVVIMGRLSRPSEERTLESGARLMTLQVTVDGPTGAETVPIVCFDPPAAVSGLDIGETVAIRGRVRRRFFRAGGATQSRTEVVADAVIPARRRTAVESLLTEAAVRLRPER